MAALEIEKRDEEKACKVCNAARIDSVFVPCGHQFSCRECSAKIEESKCPVCKSEAFVMETYD